MDRGTAESPTAETAWPQVALRVGELCAERGFDLVQPFRTDWFDDVAASSEKLSPSRPGALGLLVANTRALWPRLLDALRADRGLGGDRDPIDRYTEQLISKVLAPVKMHHTVSFAHRPPFVPMQRLAERAGFAYLAPSRLSVHPAFGPWIALRAVVVFDLDGPPGPAPRLPSPCDDCPNTCERALARALAKADDWRLWVAVRDACPIGAEHRYSEEQIHYHYTKDLQALRSALRPHRSE